MHTVKALSLVYETQLELPSWLNSVRKEYHDAYLKSSVSDMDDHWKYLDIDKIMTSSVDAAIRLDSVDPTFTHQPNIELTEQVINVSDLPMGVTVHDINQLTESTRMMLVDHWRDRLSDTNSLNLSHFSNLKNIFVIEIDDQCSDSEPLQIQLNPSAAIKGTEHIKIVFISRRKSNCRVILESVSASVSELVSHVSFDVICEDHSNLHLFISNTPSVSLTRFTSLFGRVSNHSHLFVNYINRSTHLLSHEAHVVIDGSHSDVQLRGLSLLNQAESVHHKIRMHHKQPNTTSLQQFKNILIDQSKSVFSGLIYVDPIAQKTDAYQRNNNLILSDQAQSISKPELEIFADDVKCSHGSTTGQIDSSLMFYLMSRGVRKSQAIAVLLHGFIDEILDLMVFPDQVAILKQILEQDLLEMGSEIIG